MFTAILQVFRENSQNSSIENKSGLSRRRKGFDKVDNLNMIFTKIVIMIFLKKFRKLSFKLANKIWLLIFGKIVDISQFWIIKFTSCKISNSDSVKVNIKAFTFIIFKISHRNRNIENLNRNVSFRSGDFSVQFPSYSNLAPLTRPYSTC